jgi:hypothetical protein
VFLVWLVECNNCALGQSGVILSDTFNMAGTGLTRPIKTTIGTVRNRFAHQ